MTKHDANADRDRKAAAPIRVSVSFDAADYADIKSIARTKRVSAAWVVRDAIASYLDARAPLLTRDRRGDD